MAESENSARFDYDDFVLFIESGEGSTYSVQVFRSPAGISEEVALKLPFDKTNLQLRDEVEIKNFGSELFNALFTGSVQQLYDNSLIQAKVKSKRLRIKLVLTAPDLVTLPWEFLNDSRGDGDKYLSLSLDTPIIRSTKLPATIQPLPIEPPLRILGMIASPSDLPQLDVTLEKEGLEGSLEDLKKAGLVDLRWVEGQTSRDLSDELLKGPWHVFHFIGHGGYKDDKNVGFLALCNNEGIRDDLNAETLAQHIVNQSSIRLVVLNSCEGALGDQEDIFSSTASILLGKGIPAVVAMQYAITNQAAVEFSRSFYTALAAGLPVDAAVVQGRLGIRTEIDGPPEWGTPVLFSQNVDGNIFDITPKQPEAAKFESITPPPSSGTPEPVQQIPDNKPSYTQPIAPPIASEPSNSKKITRIWVTAGIILGIILALLIGGVLIKNALDNEPPAIAVIFTGTPTSTFTFTAEFTPSPTPNDSATPTPSSTPTESPTTSPSLTPTASLTPSASITPTSNNTPTESPTPTVSITPTGTPLSQIITDNQGVKMVLIPGGRFQMGSDKDKAIKECEKYEPSTTCSEEVKDETPVHWVELDPFYMDEKEVTNAQYRVCVEAGQCPPPQQTKSYTRPKYYSIDQFNEYPVIYVTWNGASFFCKWRAARLPTEAEWEAAARGGLEGELYPWGNDSPQCSKGVLIGAQYNDKAKCGKDTVPVGQFRPNGYGLYDMAGNVWEWVADWYSADYYATFSSVAVNPKGPTVGDYRVIRGGGWNELGQYLRTAVRRYPKSSSLNSFPNVGFRCAQTP